MKKDKAIFMIEGQIPETMQYELSKKIEDVAKSFGLESYLDDICEHNNTITNECSDCNEQELLDVALRNTLRELYNMCCNCLGDIVWEQCKDLPCSDETRNEIEEDIEKIIYRRLEY